MNVYSLYSGSKGNCTLITTEHYNVLIDVGTSMKKINDALLMSEGLSLDDIHMVLLTHSHIDHIQAVKTIYNKYTHIQFISNLPTLLETQERHKIEFDEDRWEIYDYMHYGTLENPIQFSIDTFKLNHDVECRGYVIKSDNDTYVHFADNGGWIDKELKDKLSNKTYYSIESNYDISLTYFDEKREPVLKKRCLSGWGHSSNIDAIKMVINLIGEDTKCVMFNHLSQETNSSELAKQWHMKHLEIYSKLDLTKHIKFSYAQQNKIVFMSEGKTHKKIRGVR